jgi:hypothetical protein
VIYDYFETIYLYLFDIIVFKLAKREKAYKVNIRRAIYDRSLDKRTRSSQYCLADCALQIRCLENATTYDT